MEPWWDGLGGLMAAFLALTVVAAVVGLYPSRASLIAALAVGAAIVIGGSSSRVWLGGSRIAIKERTAQRSVGTGRSP